MTATGTVGVDWGSSTLRVYDLEPAVPVLLRSVDSGIKRVPAGGFEDVLDTLLAELGVHDASVTLSGMITSRHGWVETPYAVVPTVGSDLARHAVRRACRGHDLTFLPGIRTDGTPPDVMRGEEVEIVGLLSLGSLVSATVVLPGTHSKWVKVVDEAVVDFATFVTGELFELLRAGSLIGGGAGHAEPDDVAFLDGVRRGFGDADHGHGLLNDLFSVRTKGLFGDGTEDLASYLSGVLIGAELRSASPLRGPAPVVVAGDGPLVDRYALALAEVGMPAATVRRPLAALGMRAVARLAGDE